MNSELPHSAQRSPELLSRRDCALLVVDVQDKLVRLVPDFARLVWNVRRLIDGAKLLGVPVLATEQYPQGLGPTIAELAERLHDRPAKQAFSCAGCEAVMQALRDLDRPQVLVVGIEAHVCVLQTALDLISQGFRVYVAVDAVGSRHALDQQTALRRLQACGASLVTTEMALFEWCQTAAAAEFKAISALVRETSPEV